jgi:subfamily B ATP-binding cassette protein MsbA
MSNLEILKRLYKDYTKKFLNKIFLAVFFSILVALSTSATAWLLDPAIEKIFINKDETLIIVIPFFIIIAFATKGSSVYMAKILMIKVAEEVKKKLQIDMLSSFIKADTEYIENIHTGKYISNLNYDVTHITGLLSNSLLNFFKDGLTLIGLITVMFFQNWQLSLIAITMIPFASFVAKTLGKRVLKVTTEAQEKSGDLNKYLIDIFKNHKLIKIFQRENFEKERSEKFINDLKEKSIKIASVFIRSTPIMEILTGIIIAILIFYSGKLIMNEQLEINNFFSFLAAMMLAYQPIKSLATLNVGIGQGLSGAKRILPIIDIVNSIGSNENKPDLDLNNGSIVFKNINFNYSTNSNNDVLKNINIEIQGKKTYALVGLSGSGKSTLLSLIPRIYDADLGDIQIDGQSIYNINLLSLRKNISVVDQNTTLFDDTIINNIKYAKPNASDEEIYNAAEQANCLDFINNLENKFQTIIGENGVRLSGGEKQRLSIARAFLKNSKIILLDEATSSLDSATEDKIQKALSTLTKNKTSIIIAHRLSTVLNANKIFVIDDGLVVASGSHESLLASSEIYKNFYEKQIKNK